MMADPGNQPKYPIPREIRRAIRVSREFVGHFMEDSTRYAVYNSREERVGVAVRIDGKWHFEEILF